MKNLSQTSDVTTDQIGFVIDDMIRVAKDQRRTYERRWYDNNFFDDGFHFRYLSRTQNKIVDLSEKQTIYNPIRAIPKASRQIRGVANLLVSQDPTPVVYPEKVNLEAYPQIAQFDPQSQQQVMQANPELKKAQDEAKRVARLVGHWLDEEMKEQDMLEKLAYMCILTAKHGVSYMQVWPDPIKQKIKTEVYDAFDIYVMGSLNSIYDSPFLIKGVPQLVSQIKANEMFNEDQLEKITPDSKFASSEIKEAYMQARYGGESRSDQSATLLLKEAYLKEYINSENMERIARQKNSSEIMEGKKEGDMVIRQVFSAGNIWLKDSYIKLPEYPFVDFRMEPGPIYQVPLIERFIPQNKSLDMIVSRLEKFVHTSVTGAWLKAKSEGNLNITNQSGGQVIEYTAIPPTQADIKGPGSAIFNLLNIVSSFIDEQGLTTSVLNKLPAGVKGYQAIESLKESEYANLVISQRRLKNCLKRICEKFLDLADDYFVQPETVYYLEKGEPQYFDVIGASAMKKRRELGIAPKGDMTELKREYRVDIEVQSGTAYTREGRKETMKSMIQDLLALSQAGFIPAESMKVAIERWLEEYQFGATADFMSAFDDVEGQGNLSDKQIEAIKVSVMEVMKDLITNKVLPDQQTRIEEAKMGSAEALVDTGVVNKKPEVDPVEAEKAQQEMMQKEEKHKLALVKEEQAIELKEEESIQKQAIERAKAQQDMRLKDEMTKAKALAVKKQASMPKTDATTSRKKSKSSK